MHGMQGKIEECPYRLLLNALKEESAFTARGVCMSIYVSDKKAKI